MLVAPELIGPMVRRMRERQATEEGLRHYRARQATVEPVVGWIKSELSCRRLLLLALRKVRGEWSLICNGDQPAPPAPAGGSRQGRLVLLGHTRLAPQNGQSKSFPRRALGTLCRRLAIEYG